MISDNLRIRVCETWSDAKELLSSFEQGWIFRGQGSNSWGLTTSLERAAGKAGLSLLAFYEKWVRDEFESGAHQYLSSHQVPEDDIEWLALMQHHGAPTRLLDFTYSPYVAAYFAVENATEWCSVWVVNASWLHFGGSREFGVTELDFRDSYHNKGYLEIAFRGTKPWVLPVEPRKKNERLLAQQGLFLLPISQESTFEANLSAALDGQPNNAYDLRYVFRVDISGSARREALQDLRRMNITRATLFPGLDGFAQSIGYRTALRGDS